MRIFAPERMQINIRNSIADCAGEVELDFDGVEFISRAFADEVYTIVKENRDNVVLRNLEGIVDSMMSGVSESRAHKRVRKTENAKVIHLSIKKPGYVGSVVLSTFFSSFSSDVNLNSAIIKIGFPTALTS